jgi:hypothetical protein
MQMQIFASFSLNPEKIFVVTSGDPGAKRDSNHDGWMWNDKSQCNQFSYYHDPWACNFLSFSHCNQLEFVQSLPRNKDVFIDNQPIRYLDNININMKLRETFQDGHMMNDKKWFDHRIHAYLQRPNVHMRLLLKKNLHRITTLDVSESVMKSLSAVINHRNNLHMHSHLNYPSPCFALHVR